MMPSLLAAKEGNSKRKLSQRGATGLGNYPLEIGIRLPQAKWPAQTSGLYKLLRAHFPFLMGGINLVISFLFHHCLLHACGGDNMP